MLVIKLVDCQVFDVFETRTLLGLVRLSLGSVNWVLRLSQEMHLASVNVLVIVKHLSGAEL